MCENARRSTRRIRTHTVPCPTDYFDPCQVLEISIKENAVIISGSVFIIYIVFNIMPSRKCIKNNNNNNIVSDVST